MRASIRRLFACAVFLCIVSRFDFIHPFTFVSEIVSSSPIVCMQQRDGKLHAWKNYHKKKLASTENGKLQCDDDDIDSTSVDCRCVEMGRRKANSKTKRKRRKRELNIARMDAENLQLTFFSFSFVHSFSPLVCCCFFFYFFQFERVINICLVALTWLRASISMDVEFEFYGEMAQNSSKKWRRHELCLWTNEATEAKNHAQNNL